jgi:hypothetical protein
MIVNGWYMVANGWYMVHGTEYMGSAWVQGDYKY